MKEAADGQRRPARYEGILGATFFPSTLESKKSPPVAVFANRDTGNIDITLLARSLHKLSGTVRYRDSNQAVTNATIHLVPIGFSAPRPPTPSKPDIETGMSRYGSSTDGSGRWSFANVPDGQYRLRVETAAGPQAATNPFVAVEQRVTVAGADIDGLAIDVSSGSRISGVVMIEGDSSELQFINISASRRQGNAVSHDRLNGSGNFTLTSVAAGEIVLSAFPYPQEKFYPKLIEVNGVDLLRTNLNLGEGEEIKDLRIVISSNVGVIAGRVLSEKNNQPLKGVKVVLVRVNSDGLRLFGGRLTTTTDEKGNYLLSAAPGVYRVVAWQLADGPDAYRVAMERASQVQGSGVTVLPNDRKQLDLWVP